MGEVGYKGFYKGLICKGDDYEKQYAENTVFEEPVASICQKGMHYCKNPFDVLAFYGFVDNKGEFNEFATVEPLAEEKTDDDKKFCTTKLKIGAKLSFPGFVKACVDFVIEKTKYEESEADVDKNSAQIGSSGYSAKIGSSGDYAQIGSSGDYAQIGSSGDYAKIGSSGDYAKIGSSGDYAKIGSSGYSAKIGSSGNSAQIGSSGDSAQIGSSGYSAKIGSSGNSAQIGSSGYSAQIGSSGYSAKIGSSGNSAKIGSSGNSAQIGSSGDYAQVNSTGKYAVVMCAGNESIAKAEIGSFITLAEWQYSEEVDTYIPVNVVTEKVDGERIKANTYYKLIDGKFTEVEV